MPWLWLITGDYLWFYCPDYSRVHKSYRFIHSLFTRVGLRLSHAGVILVIYNLHELLGINQMCKVTNAVFNGMCYSVTFALVGFEFVTF